MSCCCIMSQIFWTFIKLSFGCYVWKYEMKYLNLFVETVVNGVVASGGAPSSLKNWRPPGRAHCGQLLACTCSGKFWKMAPECIWQYCIEFFKSTKIGIWIYFQNSYKFLRSEVRMIPDVKYGTVRIPEKYVSYQAYF